MTILSRRWRGWSCAAQLADIAQELRTLNRRLDIIMATLSELQAAVAAEQTVEAGVVTLLQTLSADLTAALAASDPAALQAVIDTINANAAALAAAVTANTPAPAASTVAATPTVPGAA